MMRDEKFLFIDSGWTEYGYLSGLRSGADNACGDGGSHYERECFSGQMTGVEPGSLMANRARMLAGVTALVMNRTSP